MRIFGMSLLKTLLLIQFLLFSLSVFSQHTKVSINQWVSLLKDKNADDTVSINKIEREINGKDSGFIQNLFSQLEKEGKRQNASDLYFMRLLFLKGSQVHSNNYPAGVEQVIKVFEEVMNRAHKTGKEKHIAFASWKFGTLMYAYQEMELAVTYCTKGIELYEKGKLPGDIHLMYKELGGLFYNARDYNQSIFYCYKAISHDARYIETYKLQNTLGQNYYQLGELDSAMKYYNLSFSNAVLHNDESWKGINACYLGQVYLARKEYEKANKQLHYSYSLHKQYDITIAARSLQLLAKTYLELGLTDSAEMYINKALRLFGQNENKTIKWLQYDKFLQHVYFTKADIHRTRNQKDSFYFFYQLYTNLHDSLEQVAALSSSRIAQLRINNERNIHSLQSMQTAKAKEEQKRNIIIGSISLLAIIIILILNRQKTILKYKEEVALFQKAAADIQTEAARNQLKDFTKSLLEKSTLLEDLQNQLSTKALSKENQEMLSELSSLTILTDDDWIKFKQLFEKLYPGFFLILKETYPDITLAEQRMAALSRLHLTSRQMAAILGISVDSVHKTRQRLRLRLKLSAETNIEEFVASI